MHWVNGLQGDDASNARDAAFTLQQRTLGAGERLSLGAAGRSSEQTVPWFAVDSGSRRVLRRPAVVRGLVADGRSRARPDSTLTLGLARDVDDGHVGRSTARTPFFGVTRGDVADASAALRTFILRGLRGGRPFDPLVTYNTVVRVRRGHRRGVDAQRRSTARRRSAPSCSCSTRAGTPAPDAAAPAISRPGLGTWQVDRAPLPVGAARAQGLRARSRA